MEVEEFSSEALAERLSLAERAGTIESGECTLKERFRRTMFYQEVDLKPNFEFGYWDRTLDRWRTEGMPDWVVDEASAYDFFGIENWVVLPLDPNPKPICEHETLEQTEEYEIYRDGYGIIARINREGDRSIPHFLEYPVKDRESWQPFIEALNPDLDYRYEKLDDAIERVHGREDELLDKLDELTEEAAAGSADPAAIAAREIDNI